VVRRMPKKIRGLSRDSDLMQDLADHVPASRVRIGSKHVPAYLKVRYLKTGGDR
jgi:hypothetical protein